MMALWTAWTGGTGLARSVLPPLGGAAFRGTVVILLAAVIVRCWPRASAAQRHAVWAVACCGQLLLPVLTLIVPEWRASVHAKAIASLLHTFATADNRPHVRSVQVLRLAVTPGTTEGASEASSVPLDLALLTGVWGMGALVVMATLLDGRRRLRRAVKETRPLTDPCMLKVVTRAAREARVPRPVEVRMHHATIPMVFGVLRPAIILPERARAWDEVRLYNVLLHELEHVKRHDCLMQTVVSAVCVLYWFNPLVWLAARALQMEQEQACDDAVLAAGSSPSHYAADLLELTQTFRLVPTMSLAVLPFARPSQLQTRVRSIVDRSRRRGFVSRWGMLAVWGAGMGVVSPLASMTPQWKDPAMPVQHPAGRTAGRQSITTNPKMENRQMKSTPMKVVLGSLAATGFLAGTPARSQAQTPPLQGIMTGCDSIDVDSVQQINLVGQVDPSEMVKIEVRLTGVLNGSDSANVFTIKPEGDSAYDSKPSTEGAPEQP